MGYRVVVAQLALSVRITLAKPGFLISPPQRLPSQTAVCCTVRLPPQTWLTLLRLRGRHCFKQGPNH